MEIGVLTQITQMFREASIGWAPVLAPFMVNLLVPLVGLGLVFLALGLLFHGGQGLIEGLVKFCLLCGFSLCMIQFGWELVDSWFNGVKHLAYVLGSPPLDPSAIASYGPVLADPIGKSLADQGWFSFAANPMTYLFGFAGTMMSFAFFLLAMMLMGFLFLSYFLTAACPWFFVWLVFFGTRGITMGYISLVFGTMNGLFCIMLMVAITNEWGALLEQMLRTKFLAEGVTLTSDDYEVVFFSAVALCAFFVFIPLYVARAMGGVVMGMSGGRMLAGLGGLAAGGISLAVSGLSGKGSGQQPGGGGGQQPHQLAAPGGSTASSVGSSAGRQPQNAGSGGNSQKGDEDFEVWRARQQQNAGRSGNWGRRP